MSPSIPEHILASAPRRWVHVGNGMRVRVIDPDWRRQQEALSDPQRDAEWDEATRDHEAKKAYRAWAFACLGVQVLKPLDEDREDAEFVMRDVLEAHPYVTVSTLKGSRGSRSVIAARHHVAYELHRRCPNLSTTQIGRILGGRDHTTIIHAIRHWPAKAAKLGIHVHPLGREGGGE